MCLKRHLWGAGGGRKGGVAGVWICKLPPPSWKPGVLRVKVKMETQSQRGRARWVGGAREGLLEEVVGRVLGHSGIPG